MYRPKKPVSHTLTAEQTDKMYLRAVRSASHHCPDLVSPTVASALSWYAREHRTKDSSVLMSLLALTSTLIAGHIGLKTHKDLDYHVTPALLMLNVGSPGSSKSVAVNKFCMQPLTTIGSLTQKTFFGRPANSSSFRKLILATDGKCALIGDEFNRVLTDLTSGAQADESIGFINSGWSGGRITANYVKATSFDFADSCISCHGAIHPPTLANMVRTWTGGEGLKERWLYSVIADDNPDARATLEHKLAKTEPPFDIEATFLALYQYCREQVELLNLVLSPDALERYLKLSEEIDELKKKRREHILDGDGPYTLPSCAKEEEMILKVTLVLHVLENALISYKATGMIDIPDEIPSNIIERAIQYVRTSNQVLRYFSDDNPAKCQEAEMLLISGKLLIPQVVSEATRQRNKFLFADPQKFVKLAKTLQKAGLGQLLEIKYKKTANAIPITTDVYFKSPPSESLTSALAAYGLALPDYEDSYKAKYNIRASQDGHLGVTVRVLEKHDPFSRITGDPNDNNSDNEGIDTAAVEDLPPAKKKKLTLSALSMHSPVVSDSE